MRLSLNVVPVDPSCQRQRHPQAAACLACPVRHSALFGALDAAALERIHVHIDDLMLAADAPLYSLGQPGGAAYTVRSGIVRFERATARGDRRIVRLAGRGDLIGQEALLSLPFADDAVACTEVHLCRIPRSLIDAAGDDENLLLREVMRRLQGALDDSQGWLADLATGPARRRVLRLLEKLGQYTDSQQTIWLPRREEIGAMLDMTVETASRLISQLRREGVIHSSAHRGAQLDAAALAKALRQQDEG